MATVLEKSNSNETDIWNSAVGGDTKAFEQVVISHQSAVSAVAFSIVGDFAISQDIAQETFWAAWKSKDSLRDAKRLGAWLCGISRNLARQWNRSKSRRQEVAAEKFGSEFDSQAHDPADDFVSKEEESVVWTALEKIPENYREVLVLYYRQGQSIGEVAKSLNISNDAARQRLSRGREILRSRVSNMIEGVLDRTNPTRSFTSRVMAGIAGAGIAGSSSTAKASISMVLNSSTATSAATVAKVMGTGSALGLLGGMLGAGLGFLGAWFGTWWPAQLAPTETERHLLLERGRTAMKFCSFFTLIVVALIVTSFMIPEALIPVGILFLIGNLIFIVGITVHGVRTQKLVAALRKELDPDEDPNQSKYGQSFRTKAIANAAMQPQRFGRRYQSKTSFLGLPLLDIKVADPPRRDKAGSFIQQEACAAKGWIAIGDKATGFIAIGGRTLGVVSIGGFAMGGITIGGVAIGLFSIGGVAMGWLAFGGAAIGYDVAGGAAIGWHSAVGGAAIAWHAAMGGASIANDFAVGGGAIANEVNTDLSRKVINEESFMWLLKSNWLFMTGVAVVSSLGVVLAKAMYTNTPPASK